MEKGSGERGVGWTSDVGGGEGARGSAMWGGGRTGEGTRDMVSSLEVLQAPVSIHLCWYSMAHNLAQFHTQIVTKKWYSQLLNINEAHQSYWSFFSKVTYWSLERDLNWSRNLSRITCTEEEAHLCVLRNMMCCWGRQAGGMLWGQREWLSDGALFFAKLWKIEPVWECLLFALVWQALENITCEGMLAFCYF